ncbi:MAG: hypothetical protein OYG32_01540, partial [Rhodospirillaceae bacterium]|nr:hypothetical protein [Rhodospirillaceae bacterium]
AGTAPVETPNDQESRSPGIIARTDSLVVSTLHGQTNHRLLPTFEAAASCSRVSCTWTEPTSGYSPEASVDDSVASSVDATAVVTKNGVTMLESRDADFRNYGAWLNHSAFGVTALNFSATIAGTGIKGIARFATAGGDLSRSRPGIVVTWRGLMTAMPVSGGARGNVLQGDALLTYKTAGNLLDAEFSNIVNLDRGRAHDVPGFRFLGVPVSGTGTFAAGSKGNRIQGGIYGPGHAEAAGIVERSGVIGAFGAKRQ